MNIHLLKWLEFRCNLDFVCEIPAPHLNHGRDWSFAGLRIPSAPLGARTRWKQDERGDQNGSAESAGINRQEAEDENSSRERSSDPLGPEFCAVGREARREA